MTPKEHATQLAAVRSSVLLAPSRAERREEGWHWHMPVPVRVLPGPHMFVVPVVSELCAERKPL
jgi:hypothetical protein